MTDKFDTLESLVHTMTPDIHQRLKTAVELGKWENGEKLTEEQRAQCLQAVIAYDQAFLAPEQRVGYIKKPPEACSGSGGSKGKHNG